MRIVIQRVSNASVTIDEVKVASIQKGVLILLGIVADDTQEDIDWLVRKTINLRIFNDVNGIMNASLLDVDGEILVVSQFTLHASIKKGNRPSSFKAAKPNIAIQLYQNFLSTLEIEARKKIQSGEFGADMKVTLLNDGPITIIIDSKNRE